MNELVIRSGKYNWPKAINCDKEPFFFISYSHRNRVLVCHDLSLLHNVEIPFWYDDGMVPGQNWKEKAFAAMNHPNCKGAMFFISKASVNSASVYEELIMAHDLLIQKDDFSVFSVNIGNKSISSMIKDGFVPEKYGVLYHTMFTDNKIFIGRKNRVLSTDHIPHLLEYFDNHNMLKEKYSYMAERNPFVLTPYENGYLLSQFKGDAEEVIIPKEIGGKKIIAIGYNAFTNNLKLKKVEIRGDVTEIFDSAFENCVNLKSIVFNNSLLRIGNNVFKNCKKIKNIIFPSQLKDVGDYSFYLCTSLSTVDFNFAKLSIGYACFSQCVSLCEIKAIENITSIGGYAFGGCMFSTFTVFDGLQQIGTDCFVSNPNLKYLYFDCSCLPRKMGESIVALCPKFVSIVVPVTMADKDLKKLKKIENVQKQLQPIKSFSNNKKGFVWEKVAGADEYQITVEGKTYIRKQCFLPFKFAHKKYNITIICHNYDPDIADSSFSLIYTIKKMHIEGDTLIGGSFYKGIINTDTAIQKIGKGAFSNDLDIKKLDFRGEVIQDSAFESALSLNEVILRNPTAIEKSTFKNCTGLKSFCFEKVTKISESSFECCGAIKSVNLSNNITVIPAKAFRRCHGISTFNMSENIIELGEESLRGCMGLTKLDLPASIQKIGPRALTYLIIKEITLPTSLEILGEDNLQNCSYLEKINISCNKKYSVINECLVHENAKLFRFPPASKTDIVIVPENVSTICKNAFRDCSYITRVYVQNVEVIETGAFCGCKSLQEVYLSGAIRIIESKAFDCCPDLRIIFIDSEVDVDIADDAINKHTEVIIKKRDKDV